MAHHLDTVSLTNGVLLLIVNNVNPCRQILFTGSRQVLLRDYNPYPLKGDEILIKTLYSGISAGSEWLIYAGLISQKYKLDESISDLNDNLNYPCAYGYANIGIVTEVANPINELLLEKIVFSFNPHQEYSKSSYQIVFPLPTSKNESKKYIFLPNLETAISLVMDANPLIGEKIAIIGSGVVGHLVTQILKSNIGLDIHVIEPSKFRRDLLKNYPITVHDNIGDLPQNIDLVFELSGNIEALPQIYSHCRCDSRIIVGSWYGDYQKFSILDTQFHRKRIRLIGSQVSNINPNFKHFLTKEKRFHLAIKLINQLDLNLLITHNIPFTLADKAYKLLEQGPDHYMQICLNYEDYK